MEMIAVFSTNPRCQIVPLPDQQVAFVVDGVERLRWHASHQSPRPFFYPLIGPSGFPLTRMGHPGASNHDHHRSIWFAHHRVLGIDFWSDETTATIRQLKWRAYEDGEDEGRMAVELAWYDGHDPEPLLLQELVAAIRPGPEGEVFLELQTSLRSVADQIELGVTNFGLLAVRVAKSISAVFGRGELTGSNRQVGEQQLFGKSMSWVDYSGNLEDDCVEGITYFDHKDNATFPSKWHVRDDGWMGASVCREQSVILTNKAPTTWRYLLHAHSGTINPDRTDEIAELFGNSPGFVVSDDSRPHYEAVITRTK